MNTNTSVIQNQTETATVNINSDEQNIKISNESLLTLHKKLLSSHLIKICITVNPLVSAALQQLAIDIFRKKNLDGFHYNDIPTEYIEENFKHEITTKLKEYLLKHLVINYLLENIQLNKIPVANYPRLNLIDFNKEQIFNYYFDISTADPIELKEWKNFSFKSPKRKKYKDLDKQVINFIESETSEAKKNNPDLAETNDWIYFEAILVDKDKVPLYPFLKNNFWIKIKNQEAMDPLHAFFLGKKVSDSFISHDLELDNNNDFENYNFSYLIKINAIVKGSYLTLDLFRATFKLKNKIDVHNKLMEVFSYRNDISQRKLIVEEIFHLLLSKHRFEIPKHLVLRRQEDILANLAKQPDYQVYKAQKNFNLYVEMLAEKQLKEEIIIDQITYQENFSIELADMQHYLHLFNNKRLREFIYFKPLLERIDETTRPINTTLLNQSILREKTLNHIIHLLTH